MKLVTWALLSALIFLSGAARTETIRVLASGAIKPAYTELVPEFEKTHGIQVNTTWSGAVDTNKRMQAGEVFDLVIGTNKNIDTFITQGTIVPGSRVDLVKVGIGVAVKAGAPRPDISSGEALKKVLLDATSIGYSTGPSGTYMENLFKRLGIADQIKGKLKTTVSGVPVGVLVARGEVQIGFQQVSEMRHIDGMDYLGPLPADIQNITVFSGGIHTQSRQAEAGRKLMTYLTQPAADAAIQKAGMDPAR